MNGLFDTLIKFRLEIAGTLIITIIVAYLAGLNNRRNRFANASNKFRDTIHAELKGVHPSIELYLSIDEINTIIWQSIPQIQTAVSNFKHFLPFFCRRKFEIAAQNYYKTARETYWQRTPDFSKSMSHIKTENPKEKFYHAVKNLLKYAKKT